MIIMMSSVTWCGSHVGKKEKFGPVYLWNHTKEKIETWQMASLMGNVRFLWRHMCLLYDVIIAYVSLYRVQPVAASCIIGWDAAMLLMQCPPYQYTGAHFADLGRMTGWLNLLVYLIQQPTGLELRILVSQANTLTTKPTPGYNFRLNSDFCIPR